MSRVEREFWLERWRTGQTGFHQREIHAGLRAHWADLRVPAGAPVLVPLCGKSRDMTWLRGQGHPVLGVELSPLAVQEFFAESDLAPRVSRQGRFERREAEGVSILCGDVFDLAPSDLASVAGVYDRAALVALPPELRARYAATLRDALPPNVAILLVTFDYAQRAMAGPPFAVPDEEVRRLFGGWADVARLSGRDALAAEPRFRERGLTRLDEQVYAIRRDAKAA